MRRSLVLAALLLAAPLGAQEPAGADQPDPAPAAQSVQAAPAAAPAPASDQPEAAEPRRPSLHVSAEQIDAQLQADARESDRQQIGSQSFWYLVAAIALGVLIAIVITD